MKYIVYEDKIRINIILDRSRLNNIPLKIAVRMIL